MNALYTIIWFVLLIINVLVIFEYIGYSGLVRMFPEGWRWWQLPVQLLSLCTFAGLIHWNPF